MERHSNKIIWLIATFMAFSSPTSADNFIEWHSTNLQLLRGWDYKITPEQSTIITFEHANGWKYGDFYTFTDVFFPDGGDTTYYTEIVPRFSMSKISGYDISNGFVKDVLITTMIEKPEHQAPRYLYGLGVDLKLPGFKYFKTNWLVRDNLRLSGVTHQLTLAWNYPFKIGGTQWLAEGFADFAGSEGSTVAHQLIVPRFLLDVGDLIGEGEGDVFAGVEWSYWHNKFGRDGETESAPQLQFKVNF